jgi:two-component system, NarL family, sensor histidine kinase FusK
MGQGLWARPWVRHIAVAVSYGLAVVLFREVSVSNWMILAGLRLSVLLLVPYRYWPGLMVGESGFFVYQAVDCYKTWGLVWSLCSAVPKIVFIAPVVYLMREKWSPVEKGAIHIGRLLSCALVTSIIEMIHSLSLFLVIKNLPKGYVVDYPSFGADYFIGDYLGVLTVTPMVLFAYQATRGMSWHELKLRISNNRLLWESFCLGVPVLVFLL